MTTLIEYVKNGDYEGCRKKIEQGAYLEQRDQDKNTALMVASKYGYSDLVEFFLAMGADHKKSADDGSTALIYAARKGCLKSAASLLKADAKAIDALRSVAEECYDHLINKDDDHGNTALIEATKRGDESMMRLLLSTKEIDPFYNNNDGMTALMVAAKNGHYNLIKLFFEFEVDSDTGFFFSAKLYAAIGGYYEICAALWSKGEEEKVDEAFDELMRAIVKSDMDLAIRLLKKDDGKKLKAMCRNGDTVLMYATLKNQIDLVKLLLEQGVEIDKKNNNGITALMFAVRMGHTEIVDLLLKAGADVEIRYLDSSRPIEMAINNGHMAIIKKLSSVKKYRQRRYDSDDDEWFMTIAASRGHLEVIDWLIDMGYDGDFEEALTKAARYGYIDIVKLLYKYKGDIYGVNALNIAARNGHMAVVEHLSLVLKNRAKQDDDEDHGAVALEQAALFGHTEIVKFLLKSGQVSGRYQAFENAAVNGHSDIVAVLLNDGVQMDSEHAVSSASENGYTETLKLLLDAGSDPDAAMMGAISINHVKIVSMCLHAKTKISGEILNDAVVEAAESGRDKILKLLLESEFSGQLNIERKNEAFILGARNGHDECVRLMLASKVDIDISDYYRRYPKGKTALMRASRRNHIEVVNRLIGCGADINKQGEKEKKSALMYAIERGNKEIVSLLLAANADVNIKDYKDKTALDHAMVNERYEICEMLLKKSVIVENQTDIWSILRREKEKRKIYDLMSKVGQEGFCEIDKEALKKEHDQKEDKERIDFYFNNREIKWPKAFYLDENRRSCKDEYIKYLTDKIISKFDEDDADIKKYFDDKPRPFTKGLFTRGIYDSLIRSYGLKAELNDYGKRIVAKRSQAGHREGTLIKKDPKITRSEYSYRRCTFYGCDMRSREGSFWTMLINEKQILRDFEKNNHITMLAKEVAEELDMKHTVKKAKI